MPGPNATFIHELRHRLQTLEIDLQDASNAGKITEHDFRLRLQRLARAIKHSENILAVVSAQVAPADLPSQVDLPMMSDTSLVEQKIVTTFVSDTKLYTNELAEKVRRMTQWSAEAAKGSLGWLTSVWRLVWLRAQVRRADADLASVRRARSVVEDFVSNSDIAPKDPSTSKNQKDLLTVFQEFEAATGRVTSLRARLQGEISKNQEMKKWLKEYADQRRVTSQPSLPPEAETLNSAYKNLAERLTGGAKIAGERLVIARQLATALPGHKDPIPPAVMKSTQSSDSAPVLKRQNVKDQVTAKAPKGAKV